MMIDRISGVLLALLLAIMLTFAIGINSPVRADEEVPTAGKVLNLDIRKGTLIRVSQPVATVFLADPSIADIQVKSPTLVYVFARRVGETVLYGLTGNEEVVLSRVVRVNHNLSRLRSALKKFMPGDTTINVMSMDGALVLDGHVTTPAQAEDARRIAASFARGSSIINRVNVTGANQVHLRVKIAEIKRDVVKRLGINWETIINTGGDFLVGFATGRDFIDTADSLGMFERDGTSDSAVASFSNGDIDVNVLIDALDGEGLISVLAEPNLTALSGETARFLAGGEFPIPVRQSDSDAITIEFKEFGVALAFTPTILDRGRINLRVSPESSQLGDAIEGFCCTLTTRRAETTVELGSGQSFAIGGLLQNNVREDTQKFPGLGDLPILGRLFRSEQFIRNETELVILVTPYIVNPVSAMEAALPTDGFVAPSDRERVLEGKLYKEKVGAPQATPMERGGQRLTGPAGFILD